ncbi:AGAP001031-PA [Anopheles gambiae str. PEST]|uniref:AGAP001031-PA n=1 Tax=Anopheles gambiae TaxID=7165 RepID=A7US23_ANOGA|nr:AGAP001031-PA [Anopheles gambiae str. PEST]
MNEEAQQRNPLMSMLNEEPQPPNPLMSMLSEESAAPRGSPLPTLITESASAVDVSSGGEDESDDEESVTFVTDFRTMYSDLKKKVKILIQNNLRANQKRLLKITRDRSFLLDRLAEYEREVLSSSDSDETVESEDSARVEVQPKRRKVEPSTSQSTVTQMKPPLELQQLSQHILFQSPSFVQQPATSSAYQFPLSMMSQVPTELLATSTSNSDLDVSVDEVAMEITKEELERHLQSRQIVPQVIPEGELPIEMFNNNPSSSSSVEATDQLKDAAGNLVTDVSLADLNLMNV